MRYLSFILLITESIFISSYADESDSISSDYLKSCISDYRDGYYTRAVQCINQALPGLTFFRDSVESFKMLALSYGMLNQIENSKMYFSIALEKDSAMKIDTLAFPPNIALIYNQVKLEKKVSQIKIAPAISSPETKSTLPADTLTSPAPVTVAKKKKNAVPATLLLTSVIFSATGAVFLGYNGYLAREDYQECGKNQARLDKKWKEYTYSVAGGIGCAVVSGVATWLFFRVVNKNNAVSVSGEENGAALVYNF